MRSTDGGTASLQLGLGRPEIDGKQIGGGDRVADREPGVPQRADDRAEPVPGAAAARDARTAS